MKESSIFNAQKSTSFRILCCALGRFSKTLDRRMHGNKDWDGWNLLQHSETLTESMVSQWNSSGKFFQDSIRCSSATKSKVYCTDWEKHRKISQEEFYWCRRSTTFLVEQKTMKKNVWQMLDSYLCMQEDLVKDNGPLIGPGSVKKWYSISEDSPQGICEKIAERMLIEFAESGCPIFRATTPLSRGQLKSKGHGKLSVHFAANQETIETLFRIIVSANQLSLYGAFAEICEEYGSLHERTGRPVVMGQSIVLSAIKTEVPLDSDEPANQNFLLQQYEERIEKLSQQDRLSKFCMDAGFLSVVENGQCFMTKDTADLSQFHAVACREYTLPREEPASQPKGWIQGNTKIVPVLEVATSYLHGKHGVEITVMSLSRDNTHSWGRISHGSNKFVMNLNNNETKIPEDQLEEHALKLSTKDFACRSKAKAKSQRRELVDSSPRIVSHWKKELDRYWTREIFSLRIRGIEESNLSSSWFTASALRRRRSVSFLENEGKSSESMPTIYSLVWRSVESMLGIRRRR